MIKLVGSRDGKPLYGFGLSDRNLELLRDGMPILVDLEQMGAVGNVLIFWGSSELEMVKQLKEAGLVRPEVKINEQRQFHEG